MCYRGGCLDTEKTRLGFSLTPSAASQAPAGWGQPAKAERMNSARAEARARVRIISEGGCLVESTYLTRKLIEPHSEIGLSPTHGGALSDAAQSEHRGGVTILLAQLPHQISHVLLHRAEAEAQDDGDLMVLLAFSHPEQHVRLSHREA